MDEVIRFVPKSERERTRLIRQARATYDSCFPPVGAISEQGDEAKAIRSATLMSIVATGFPHDQNHCCALQSAVSGKLPEQTVTTSDFADVSMRSCLMGAPQLADWMKQHSAERLWHSVV